MHAWFPRIFTVETELGTKFGKLFPDLVILNTKLVTLVIRHVLKVDIN
jgi:hypothetical protein